MFKLTLTAAWLILPFLCLLILMVPLLLVQCINGLPVEVDQAKASLAARAAERGRVNKDTIHHGVCSQLNIIHAKICTMYQEAGSGRGVGGWETKAEMEVDAFLFACP